jgi:hypothetical protein
MALTGQKIKVNIQGQSLTTTAPVTIRNTAADYNAIDRLTDVELSQREDNSTLVYNASTDKYEVKPINAAITDIDGGTF